MTFDWLLLGWSLGGGRESRLATKNTLLVTLTRKRVLSRGQRVDVQ